MTDEKMTLLNYVGSPQPENIFIAAAQLHLLAQINLTLQLNGGLPPGGIDIRLCAIEHHGLVRLCAACRILWSMAVLITVADLGLDDNILVMQECEFCTYKEHPWLHIGYSGSDSSSAPAVESPQP